MFAHIHGKAGVFITDFNFLRFFALSKKIVPYESLDTKRSYFNLDSDELIELVFRIVEFIYNPETYADEKAEIPKHITTMMEEPVTIQFKSTMEVILNTSIKSADEILSIKLNDEKQDMMQQPPRDDIENLMQYLPDNCKP